MACLSSAGSLCKALVTLSSGCPGSSLCQEIVTIIYLQKANSLKNCYCSVIVCKNRVCQGATASGHGTNSVTQSYEERDASHQRTYSRTSQAVSFER